MRELRARDVMNPEVVSVPDDMPVGDLAQFLVESGISGAPVEDREGRLVGLVSLQDIAAAHGSHEVAVPANPADWEVRGWQEHYNREDVQGLRVEESDLTVGEIMTPALFSVEDEAPIWQVAEKMVQQRVRRLLVTRDHKPVGIVSTFDLVKLLAEDKP
jgi:CBS domain-containing protein